MTSWTRTYLDIAWAPATVVGLHLSLAAVFGHRPELDPVFHFLGGAAGAYSLTRALTWFPAVARGLSPPQRSVAIVAVTFLVAMLWEVAEVWSNLSLGTTIEVGAANTLADLGLGLAGAVLSVLTMLRFKVFSRSV